MPFAHALRVPLLMCLLILVMTGLVTIGCSSKNDDKAHGPAPCTTAWYQLVEQKVSVGDGQGHGPDLGSGEWRSAVEFKLGIRDDPAVPDPNGDQWCAYIDAIIKTM